MARSSRLTLSQLATRSVWPVLKTQGWERRGSLFYFTSNDRGDVALVALRTFRLEGLLSFIVEIALAPTPWLDWLTFLHGPRPVDEAHAIVRRRLDQPYWSRMVTGKRMSDRGVWTVDPQDHTEDGMAVTADYVGAQLAESLNSAVPELVSLLDRERLLAFIGDEHPGWHSATAELAELVLLSDTRDVDRFERAIENCRRIQSDDQILAWAQERFAR